MSDDPLLSIKALAKQYRTWAESNDWEKPEQAARQNGYADALEAVADEIERSRLRLTPVSTSFGDLSDLPPEVIAELSLTKVDDLEQQLRDIIASAQDEIGLDSIIIELYRRHKVMQTRRFILNKLYRMAQKGLVQGVSGKKGTYKLPIVRRVSAFDTDLDDDVPF